MTKKVGPLRAENHEELLAESKRLAAEARRMVSGEAIHRVIGTAAPGAQIRRLSITGLRGDALVPVALELVLDYDGDRYICRGSGSNVAAALYSALTDGGSILEPEWPDAFEAEF